MLRRVTNSTGTTIITYPFGIEEHQYSGSGTNQTNTYYYFLAGRLLGSLDSNGTEFYLTDALGSLVSSFTNAAGGATMKSNQVFGPYGNNCYIAYCDNLSLPNTKQDAPRRASSSAIPPSPSAEPSTCDKSSHTGIH